MLQLELFAVVLWLPTVVFFVRYFRRVYRLKMKLREHIHEIQDVRLAEVVNKKHLDIRSEEPAVLRHSPDFGDKALKVLLDETHRASRWMWTFALASAVVFILIVLLR